MCARRRPPPGAAGKRGKRSKRGLDLLDLLSGERGGNCGPEVFRLRGTRRLSVAYSPKAASRATGNHRAPYGRKAPTSSPPS